MRELTVTASYSAGPGDMRAALEAIVSGSVETEPLITHRLGLEETAQALSLQRRGEALKAVVVPGADGNVVRGEGLVRGGDGAAPDP
jgi:threonine dehydrogenase-like Zn-dependent dehydrogenase